MTSMETEYLKGLDGTYSQNREQGYRGGKKDRGNKVPIGTLDSVNPPHSSNPPSFPKLMEMEGSENFC